MKLPKYIGFDEMSLFRKEAEISGLHIYDYKDGIVVVGERRLDSRGYGMLDPSRQGYWVWYAGYALEEGRYVNYCDGGRKFV